MQTPLIPMLGCEYHWLIRFNPTAKGAVRVSLSRSGLFTLAVALFCFFCVALNATEIALTPASIAGADNRSTAETIPSSFEE
jgi:hypothetical protein